MRTYGWKPDLPDHRDFKFVRMLAPTVLPDKVDLRATGFCPPVYDQGQLGSCTGNAFAFKVQFNRMKEQKTPNWNPSRLFIYYNERVIEGTVAQDAGASMRDGIKALSKYGVCPEDIWPYNVEKFATRPNRKAFSQAKASIVKKYERVNNQDPLAMKELLFRGFPIAIGFSVYDEFESEEVARTGLVPMPKSGSSLLGGHAVAIVGYDNAKIDADGNSGCWIVRNSWGAAWGDQGHFYMPYHYFTNTDLADDAWSITFV